LTNCTGLPIGSGVSGLGANVDTFLATPSSANLIAALTDETGSGAAVFATSPTLVTPALGTPASGTLSGCDAGTTGALGVLLLASAAEVATGTDTAKAITAAGVAAVYQYQTLYIDALAMIACVTNPAEASSEEYETNDIDLDFKAFDGGATEERVQFNLVMPEAWDRGAVKAIFHWSSAASSTTGDTVEWGIKAGALADSDAIDTALGDPQVITDTLLADNGTDWQISNATPAMTIAGTPGLGEMVIFEIYRNTDGTDDMAEDAWLFGVTIQFKVTNEVSVW